MTIMLIFLTLCVIGLVILCSELKRDPSVPGEWIPIILIMIVVFAASWDYL